LTRCLVTGVAGFIGSHIAETLVNKGNYVVGIDSFTDYYDEKIKQENLSSLTQDKRFRLVKKDIVNFNLKKILRKVEYVFHEAAQPGVRSSWGTNFQVYLRNNVLATQRLLEALKSIALKKFIFASSSSIYGDSEDSILSETTIPHPISPYGATKLAAEKLCYLYNKNYGIPIITLRYFTVYGPRQRPDMAFHKFIKAMLKDDEIEIFGDGNQLRDFTHVNDVVDANIAAAETDIDWGIFNIGSGTQISINKVIDVIGEILDVEPEVKYTEKVEGDMRQTLADIKRASSSLGYRPSISLSDGLKLQIQSIKNRSNLS